jgi:fermentation-respiration switch protein FrsA (DUF1100 family)
VLSGLLAFLGFGLAFYAVLVGALYVVQRRLLYLPDTTAPDPQRVGIPGIEVLRLQTDDGLSLLAWYLPPAEPGGFVVLYLHGNGGHIGHRAVRLRQFRAAGWGVLLVEYRGYGGNPGAPTEAGLRLDAEAGWAAMEGRGIVPERTLLWGESLGSSLAVGLAAGREVAAVLLESPFTSVAALAWRQYPFVPVDFLLKDRFDTLSRIAAVRSPVLIMQGGRDRLVPNAMGKTLLAAVTAPKELWVAPEADHETLDLFGAIEAAVAFVRRRT